MIPEALRRGRRIDILLRRNALNDGASDDAQYTGFDICWEDGRPAQINLARLCGIAVRQIFGNQNPCAGSYLVHYFLVPIDDPCAPRLELPRSVKPRRLYLMRQGSKATLHLANGYCTDIVFYQDDDPRMLRWIGFDQLPPGQPQWVDIVAIPGGQFEDNLTSAENYEGFNGEKIPDAAFGLGFVPEGI